LEVEGEKEGVKVKFGEVVPSVEHWHCGEHMLFIERQRVFDLLLEDASVIGSWHCPVGHIQQLQDLHGLLKGIGLL
jgi:hypothetical protein